MREFEFTTQFKKDPNYKIFKLSLGTRFFSL